MKEFCNCKETLTLCYSMYILLLYIVCYIVTTCRHEIHRCSAVLCAFYENLPIILSCSVCMRTQSHVVEHIAVCIRIRLDIMTHLMM